MELGLFKFNLYVILKKGGNDSKKSSEIFKVKFFWNNLIAFRKREDRVYSTN